MAVLKQTSPTARPVAPSPKPSSTVPSASTKSAVGLGSAQVPAEAAFGCWVMASQGNPDAAFSYADPGWPVLSPAPDASCKRGDQAGQPADAPGQKVSMIGAACHYPV